MKIAIDNELTNVKNFLENQGFDVQSFSGNKNDLDAFDAVVISGINENFMGMQDILTSTSIVNANGLTPEQVLNRVQSIQK